MTHVTHATRPFISLHLPSFCVRQNICTRSLAPRAGCVFWGEPFMRPEEVPPLPPLQKKRGGLPPPLRKMSDRPPPPLTHPDRHPPPSGCMNAGASLCGVHDGAGVSGAENSEGGGSLSCARMGSHLYPTPKKERPSTTPSPENE